MDKGYEEALRKIEEAKRNNSTELDLSGLYLSKIPLKVQELRYIRELDISNNKLVSIPKWLLYLPRLNSLNMSNNLLTNVPFWLYELTNLIFLDISNNNLDSLPMWIGDLINIKYLNINNTGISNLPSSITKLKKLSKLCISYNKLNNIPIHLNNMSNIIHLNISNNSIINLPEWFISLYNLSYLNISNNKIKELPKWISEFTNLERLFINKNDISNIPISLTKLSNLRKIDTTDCPLIEPPIEIARQGIDAILNYFNSLENAKNTGAGTVKVYEAKLMIVGEPGAGKTSLRRKLNNPFASLPDEDESTRGIDIDIWDYNYDGNHYTVNIWDFGGQEILHSTHQLFMNERALYVLLADSRKENTDYIDWLHKIELFASDSPKIIVHNEKDDRRREINMIQINKRFPGLPEPMQCNLAKINGTSRERDFYNVVDELKHKLKHLDVIGQEFPRSWIELRKKLDNLHKGNQNYISASKYYALCEELNINSSNALTLGNYLHAIGAILFFTSDPILKHIVILNPEWGTGAVYKVIDDNIVQNNMGKFVKKDLTRIWDNKTYKGKFDELLQLMMNFKICYRANKCYILPQLLPYQPVEKNYKWNKKNNLHFEYQYPDYYLKSIMIRFIVDINEYIESQKAVWRNGVVLKEEKNRAEIIADEKNRTIHIRVCGATRRDLLTIIRKTFDSIHGEYKKLKVEQMVPCNCDVCKESQEPTLYPYSKLINRLSNNKDTIECDKPPYNEIDIQTLVNDFPQIDKEGITDEIILDSVEHYYIEGIRTKTIINKQEKKENKSWWIKTCDWFSGLNNILQTVFFLLILIPLVLVILNTLDVFEISEPVSKIIGIIENWGSK